MELHEKIKYVCKEMYKSNCSLSRDSNNCPFKYHLAGGTQCYFDLFVPKSWAISNIERDCDKFIEEHHPRTRQSEMLKIIPDTVLEGGIIATCPKEVLYFEDCDNDKYSSCYDCRRAFWLKEI